jgi:hypothetical protein
MLKCLWRDIFCLSAECCSRCCLWWMPLCRSCRLRMPTGRIRRSANPSSEFIPIGNGPSASFSTPASRRSCQRSPQRRRLLSRRRHPQPSSPTPRQKRASARHLHSSCRLSPKSRNRSCNGNARLQSIALPRRWFRSRNNRDLGSLTTAHGIARGKSVHRAGMTWRAPCANSSQRQVSKCWRWRTPDLAPRLRSDQSTLACLSGSQSPIRCATTVSFVDSLPMLPSWISV